MIQYYIDNIDNIDNTKDIYHSILYQHSQSLVPGSGLGLVYLQ